MTPEPAAKSTKESALEQAAAAIPSCALTREGVSAQRARMERLSLSVTKFRRLDDRVTIDFEAGFEQQLLAEMLAVERECCPFFRFHFDAPKRRLTVSVEDSEHRAGLNALAHALGAEEAA